MTMTNEEIVRSFNNAARPMAQVKILAELNACSVEDICKVLTQNGVDPRRLSRAKAANLAEKALANGSILHQLEKEAQQLELRKGKIDEQIKALQAERQQIDPKMQALAKAKAVLQSAYGKQQ